ncbi:MAG: DUF58 domain-containing protein [Balneolaceae bacterium]|nr:DUF58 domain-containing protein [Balneolaceae bacterium]MBO6547564.1 DUF58 domain-containing protein [Balneolaceae bacterium]MBO6648075.1 DUF58 domain-containing protein [Balneolaceae bacterium]
MNFFKSFFADSRFFIALSLVCISYVLGYFYVGFEALGDVVLIALIVAGVADILLLFSQKNGLEIERIAPQRLSNGDENTIRLVCTSRYTIKTECSIVDEIPHQFQIRNFEISASFEKNSEHRFSYSLRPTNRGEFEFGNINAFVTTNIGLFKRRFTFEQKQALPVYPSFIQMRKFEMYAISNRLSDIGIKKIRRLGHTMEFDQIKEYVPGDDIRSINWKATARSQNLMVNQYQDERSQQIVNVIDMGRVMKLPFDGLNLLEYAINTSLVISNIALIKDDKAGLVTFSNSDSVVVRPEKKKTHIRKIQEALYKLETNFMESDYERLLINLKTHLNQRSLVLLYTNFETYSAMERQLPYLKRIARDHLLVTIFFENTELSSLLNKESENLDDIYVKTVAEKFNFEKRQIVKSLTRHGIHSIFTPPKELSVSAINKYLELKARGLI